MTTRTRRIDPYEVLGVDGDASLRDINAAYRRRVKDAHPDVGGSSQEFSDVKLAHSVLSNAERRAYYDRTGEVEEADPDNTEQGALGLIGLMLKASLAAETDPIECDLVAMMKAHLISELAEAKRKLGVTRRSIERAERMRGRFRRKKPGDNSIQRVLEWQLDSLKVTLRSGEAAIKQRERAIELLDDYDFANDISRGPIRVRRGISNG